MKTVTLEFAKCNLEQIANQVLANMEPITVAMPSGQCAVILPLREFDAWQETEYLLRNPANATHLRKSIAEATAGPVRCRTEEKKEH